MNLLDVFILGTILFLVVKGVIRGFVREMASLAGVVLGIFLGIKLQPRVAEALATSLPSVPFLPVLSFGVVFIAVLVSCNLLGWGLGRLFKKVFLGWLDRGLGVCLALTKGVIITYLAIVLLTFFLPSGTPLIAKSKLAPVVIVSYQSMTRFVSPQLYETWKKKFMEKKKEITDPTPEKANPKSDG